MGDRQRGLIGEEESGNELQGGIAVLPSLEEAYEDDGTPMGVIPLTDLLKDGAHDEASAFGERPFEADDLEAEVPVAAPKRGRPRGRTAAKPKPGAKARKAKAPDLEAAAAGPKAKAKAKARPGSSRHSPAGPGLGKLCLPARKMRSLVLCRDAARRLTRPRRRWTRRVFI